jgi:radical SAM superfamily enzyme YgiQ (UPF0313 family)
LDQTPWAPLYYKPFEGEWVSSYPDRLSRLPHQKKKYFDGKFYKVKMEKPQPLKSIPQHYSRYGITEEMLLKRFSKMEKPDVIGITSGMTYWYPGLFKTIEMTKNVFNDVPIILGGIYATLCYEHALRHSGADYIIKGKGELKSLKLVSELTHSKIRSSPKLDDPDYFPLYNAHRGI